MEKDIEYFKAQNTICDSYFQKSQADEILKEIESRFKNYDSVPVYKNGVGYFSRERQSKEYPQLYRIINSKDELLFDQNKLAGESSSLHVGQQTISEDNAYFAYSYNTTGDDNYTLVIMDCSTKKKLLQIEHVGSCFEFIDNEFLFTRNNEKYRSFEVYRCNLQGEETRIFREDNEQAFVFLQKSADKSRVFINSSTKTTNQVYEYFKGNLKELTRRQTGVEHYYEVHNDEYLFISNAEHTNFQLFKGEKILVETPKGKIEEVLVFKNYIVLLEQYEVTHIHVIDLKTLEEYYIDFDVETYALQECFGEYHSTTLRIAYETMIHPLKTFEFDLEKKEWKKLRFDEVVCYNPDDYVQEYFHVGDVPVSLCYKKGCEDKLLLTGYGAYGITLDPYFSKARIALLNRGVGFGIVHVRGGGKKGEEWYLDGKFLNKKNTFEDFLQVAKYFVSEGVQLSIAGASAGGMLVGNVLNQYPQLFSSAIAKVPFVDVLTTMLDESLPLTVEEFEEWGNPKDSQYYDYIKSYSPVDNVSRQEYPGIYITTGINDTRVSYVEPLKWHKKLAEMKTSTTPLLLECNLESGHLGYTSRKKAFKEISRDYAFVLKEFS